MIDMFIFVANYSKKKTTITITEVDPGEGPRGNQASPLFLDQTETPPPTPYLKVWICHWITQKCKQRCCKLKVNMHSHTYNDGEGLKNQITIFLLIIKELFWNIFDSIP